MTAVATHGRLTAAYLTVALLALLGGVVTGLAQGLEHAGINVYPALAPVVQSYYHGLSLHGVLNVLVWTTFFICGFLPFIAVEALGRPLASARLGWARSRIASPDPGPSSTTIHWTGRCSEGDRPSTPGRERHPILCCL